ncbi:DUF3810 family protein [bacterium]|nr:DUF3810 family protein [bacterium]
MPLQFITTLRKLLKSKRLRLIVAILLPVQFILFKAASFFPSVVEYAYSRGLYRWISYILKTLTFWLPISLGQLIFYAAVFWLLYRLIQLVLKLKRQAGAAKTLLKEAAINVAALLSVVYFFFIALWGLNYNRQDLYTILALEKPEIESTMLKSLAEQLVEKTNQTREEIDPVGDTTLVYDWKNSDYFHAAKESYQKLGDEMPVFIDHNPSVKAVVLPQLMSYAGLGGIYFPFTGEANVNMHQPDFKLPATICHEMAHQAGFASETEANFIAFLACRQSNDPQFRYSGYLSAMRHVLHALHKADTVAFNQTIVKVQKGVLLDLEANTLYWEQYETFLDAISAQVNDWFLKANGEQDGIDSYGLVVNLLVADYLKQQKAAVPAKAKTVETPKQTENKVVVDPDFLAFCQAIPTLPMPFSFNCQAPTTINPQLASIDSSSVFASISLFGKLMQNEQLVVFLWSESGTMTDAEIVAYQLDGNQTRRMKLMEKNWCADGYAIEKASISTELMVTIQVTKVNCNQIDNSEICDTVRTEEQRPFMLVK